MRIMAHTMAGKMEEIKIASCPLLIAPNVLTLLDRCDSPLYLADTVVLYDEINNVMEGDIVTLPDRSKTGIVYYTQGWRIHWSDNSYNKYVASEHILMTTRPRKASNAQAVRRFEEREEIRVVVDEESFYFTSMMAKIDTRICISGKPQLVNQNEIYLSTGICDAYDAPIYFGQFYKGGIVGLNKEMRIVSECKDKIINLED